MSFPLRGNGWYFDFFVEECLNLNLIKMSDIKFQVKASQKLQQYHFKQFVLDMYEVFDTFSSCNAGKLAVNGFIGLLGKSKLKKDKTLFGN